MPGASDLRRSGIYALIGFAVGVILLLAVIDYQASIDKVPILTFIQQSNDKVAFFALILGISTISGLIVGDGHTRRRRLHLKLNELIKERDKLRRQQVSVQSETSKLKGLLDQESGFFVDNWDQLVTEKDNLREEAEVSSTLLQVALAIGNLAGPSDVLSMLTSSLPSALFADGCLTFAWDDETGAFVSAEENLSIKPRSATAIKRLQQKHVPVAIDDVRTSGLLPKALIEQLGIKSAILIPCLNGDKLIAIAMAVYTKADHNFTERDLQIASGIVNQAKVVFENAHLYQEVVNNQAELKELLTRLASLQEEERRRISRDLHDGVIQNLSGIIFSLSFLEKALGPKQDSAKGEIQQLAKIVEDTIADLRQVIYDLRPTILDSLGLVPTLEKHLERFSQANGVEIAYNPQIKDRLPEIIETGLFRLAQESLNNIKKHARAKKVALDLKYGKECVIMVVTDDGRGFNMQAAKERASQDSGFGLSGMRERVQSLDGSVEITSQPGEGTRVLVTVPLSPKLGNAAKNPVLIKGA